MNIPPQTARASQLSYRILLLPAFKDNYIWVLQNDSLGEVIAVAPGDAQPVLDYLARENLKLVALLITHHHGDHTGGIARLCEAYPAVRIYGSPQENIPLLNAPVTQDDRIHVPGWESQIGSIVVMETPGHTHHHLAYLVQSAHAQDHGVLFCGDTLFSAGCGRLFEGTPAQMQASLARLRNLSRGLLIYCAHEYTERNLEFALKVEPENQDIANYAHHVQQRRASNQPTLPTTLQMECAINPFLRWDVPTVQQAAARYLGLPLNTFMENRDDVAVFAAIRAWRNES